MLKISCVKLMNHPSSFRQACKGTSRCNLISFYYTCRKDHFRTGLFTNVKALGYAVLFYSVLTMRAFYNATRSRGASEICLPTYHAISQNKTTSRY